MSFLCVIVCKIFLGNIWEIEKYAFFLCLSLTDIKIPDSVTEIGDCAFGNCSKLTNVEISDSVTTIGTSAFGFCRSLTSIEIPDGVTEIGYEAFRDCDNLKEVVLSSNTKYEKNSFPKSTKIVIRDEKENAKDNKEKTHKNKTDYADV